MQSFYTPTVTYTDGSLCLDLLMLDLYLDAGCTFCAVHLIPALAVPRLAILGALVVTLVAPVEKLLATFVAIKQQCPGALIDVAYVGACRVLVPVCVVSPA